jgi:cytochrome c oxidase subunit 2
MSNKLEEKRLAEEAAKAAAASSWALEDLMREGEPVYNRVCAACHKPDGSGLPPTFPALKGSPIATDADRVADHINIVVHGKAGSMMQAFGAQLSDVELAAVITYERNAWGNSTGQLVQPSEIAAVKNGQ